MKGQSKRVEDGNLVDAFYRLLDRIGSWGRKKADDRRNARCFAASFLPGTRVLLTGNCCAMSIRYTNRQGTLLRYENENSDDYKVLVDGREDEIRRLGWVCVQGFRPTGGVQPSSFTYKVASECV
jgi:hypothetical protein